MSAYRIISAERASFPVSLMCQVLGVSRSGCYGWANGVPSDRALNDAWLTEKIREIHARTRGVYGARRVHAELRLGEGIHVSRKRVERLMRQAGYLAWLRAAGGALRSGCRASGSLMISSNASSLPWHRTCCGSLISPTSRRGRAGCISPPSRMRSLAGSWGGRWPIICAPSWSSTRCRWASPGVARTRGLCTIPTRARRPGPTSRSMLATTRPLRAAAGGLSLPVGGLLAPMPCVLRQSAPQAGLGGCWRAGRRGGEDTHASRPTGSRGGSRSRTSPEHPGAAPSGRPTPARRGRAPGPPGANAPTRR